MEKNSLLILIGLTNFLVGLSGEKSGVANAGTATEQLVGLGILRVLPVKDINLISILLSVKVVY